MLLNLLNLYSLIFALFSKIEGMSKDLDSLKPTLNMNTTNFSQATLNFDESLIQRLPLTCFEVRISCTPCNMPLTISTNDFSVTADPNKETLLTVTFPTTPKVDKITIPGFAIANFSNFKYLTAHNLIDKDKTSNLIETTTENSIEVIRKQMKKHRQMFPGLYTDTNETSSESNEYNETDIDYYDELTTDDAVQSSSSSFVETGLYENFTTVDMNVTTPFNYQMNYNDLDTYSKTTAHTETTDYMNSFENITLDVYNGTTINTNSLTDNETESIDITDNILTSKISYTDDYTTGAYSSKDFDITTVAATDLTTTYLNNTHQDKVNVFETVCPKISFNCSAICGDKNVTQVFKITNCTLVEKRCYITKCQVKHVQSNTTMIDVVYEDEHCRRMYNLTNDTKKKLLKLCWETMFGQELVKLTMMDLVFVFLGTLFMDFFRALFVRYMNRCWCWDLEKKFPEYGDFKIAENILHLINNQGMVWMGMFFSPGLVVLNVSKLMIMMYLRSWAVMTCNVPHEVVFRVSKSNNFYLALLLTMLFLCVLPVGYSIVWVKPSWHCGPFSEYDKIYYILTSNIYKILPKSLNFALEYVASPAIVIPLLVLLILIIYYLTSLTNSLREANNDLKIQLRRERTEERRKMFQLADTRRRVGSSALDNTPFARWKRALPGLPLRSLDSDDRKTSTGEDMTEPFKAAKKRGGGIFAKIVGMALDKKPNVHAQFKAEEDLSPSTNMDDETDTDFHENLPKDVLKLKDITMKQCDSNKKLSIEIKPNTKYDKNSSLKVKQEKIDEFSEKKAIIQKQKMEKFQTKPKPNDANNTEDDHEIRNESRKFSKFSSSQSSTQSKQSDSITSIIPLITISTTESDEDLLRQKEEPRPEKFDSARTKCHSEKESIDKVVAENRKSKIDKPACEAKIEIVSKNSKNSGSDFKSLRRQSSVDIDGTHEVASKEKKADEKKYQHSL